VETITTFVPQPGGARARVFAPAAGVPEDPATGSAAGPLGVQLVRRGHHGPGDLLVRQGHELGRPSEIEVGVAADGTVTVGGSCVVLGRGFLEI
jgi:trans-2,3-dihydro-3-hydroxyanthranilate isomerase